MLLYYHSGRPIAEYLHFPSYSKPSLLFCVCVCVRACFKCVYVHLLSTCFHICLRCVFGSAPHVINVLGGKLCVSDLVRSRWMYAADSNLHFFCRDLGITLVVRCNLLLVWASAVAGERLRVCVCLCVYEVCACVRAVWSYDEVFCSVDMLWLLNLG